MQIFRLFFSFFLLFVLFSCEKEVANEQDAGNLSDGITDEIKNGALTVAQAMDVEPGYWITVKGYIVAAAESSIKNADFRRPFAGKTAILLADKPYVEEEHELDDFMPISLSDAAKGISTSLNLQDNPDNWNNFIYIHGIRKSYLSAPGIKEVDQFWIDPDHKPEPSEPTVDPDDPDDPEDPDNPDNPDTEFIDGYPVYTINQALSNKSLEEHNIWVKGYIIASAKRSMGSMDFEAPFDSDAAIILAENPVTAEDIQHIKDQKDYEGLFPVVFSTKFKSAKDLANLKDNPDNHNILIYILGNLTSTSVGKKGISYAIDAKFSPLK